jgi:hypothetical protein
MNRAITTNEVCSDEQRREKVRNSSLSGLDYVEVSEDQLRLSVYFLGKAPEGLDTPNVIIEGGRRVRNIQVLDVQVYGGRDPDLDDWMEVTVDKAGDFSTYTLCLVSYDPQGQPIYGQFPGVDRRYSQVDFSFKAGCPGDLDCQTTTVCPPAPVVEPEINYLAKDYESFRQLILDRLALTIPNWQETHIPDIGIALVEILAYVGDYLSYYQDAVATEAYLGTARQRISVRRHVRLVDYQIHEGCNARAWLSLKTKEDQTDGQILPTNIYFISGASGSLMQDSAVQQLPQGSYQVFEPLVEDPKQPLQLYLAHNEIHFYTWGDKECCLPRGATTVTLQDYTDDDAGPVLHLNVGDFVLFEEAKGAKTGVPADADPTHRWVVRLTSVQQLKDELYDKNVIEVTWGKEDALPFPLCLSAIGPAPDCALIENISVARGNILLVDNGQTIGEDLSCVPVAETKAYCDKCERQAADIEVSAGPYNPVLKQSPLTYSQPLPASAPASQLLTQNPRQAMPQITLGSTPPGPDIELTPDTPCPDPSPIDCCDGKKLPTYWWLPLYDLLESGSEDRNFVVEIDNNGVAHLRFGDDELGRAPDPLESFCARYRVGNGSSGNVGSETITTVVLRNISIDGLTCCNPLAATGGTDSESISEIKLYAPGAFTADQERAITADDYARLAGNYPGVQRAAAFLRWTGMNYEALVAVDPFGTDTIQHTLLRKIEHYLQAYRRIGHDVKVVQAQYVPIALAMTICVLPNYLQAHVKAALLAAFSNGILPDGTRGFFHPDNLSFGDSIPVSAIVATAQAVPGVLSVTVNTFERYGEDSRAALDLGVLLIGPMEIAQLDNDQSNPEHGTLTFTMRGGR